MAHEYTVELRFLGDDLDPEEITKALKLTPSSLWAAGDPSPVRYQPHWSYNGHDAPGFSEHWADLDAGLSFLLGRLDNRLPEIRLIAQNYQAVWWCGHFQSSFGGGPMLSSRALSDLARSGIPLFIDCYFSDAESPSASGETD